MKTTITKKMRDAKISAMVEAVEVHHDFLVGNASVYHMAEAWVDQGFEADTAGPWWLAGCFDAAFTAQCDDAGLTPDDLAKPSDHPGLTVGYAVCNMDMTVEDALRRTK